MTKHTPTEKSFVTEDSHATIVCPECSSTKTISVEEFRHRQHVLKIKCKCGYAFNLQLEFRQFYRKDTDLQGEYDLNPPARGGGIATIVNLSLIGACFEVRDGVHGLQTGHKGSIVFTLDNRKETVLYRQVIIRSVNGNRIGCEFVDDRAFDKELGFYLLP